MTVDLDRGDESTGAELTRRTVGTVSAILSVFGGLAAIATIIDFFRSGKLDLIFSEILFLVLIVGIVVLFLADRRRSVLMVVMLVVLMSALVGAVFFARTTRSLLSPVFPGPGPPIVDLPPPDAVPTSHAPPPVSANPSSQVTPAAAPTWATRSPTVQTPNPSTPPPAPPPTPSKPPSPSPPPAPSVTTGEFASPIDRQQTTGPNFVAAGKVNGLSSALLCIVRDESENNFPYPARSDGDGRWDAVVGTGPRKEIERWYPFTLILATATQSALGEIGRQQADAGYCNVHGVGKNLPPGIAILAEVGIIRTS